MAYSDNFPATRPVFMADFANGGKIDPRATFSRPDSPINSSNAPASAVHYWSNEKHLSSENLLLQSSDFDTAWSNNSVAIASGQTDPAGSTNGFTITENSLDTYHRVYQGITASGSFAFTVYAKQNSGTRYLTLTIKNANNDWVSATYDLAGNPPATGSGSSSNFSDLSATQTASGNGYYKCVLKATGSVSSDFVYLYMSDDTSAAVGTYGLKTYQGDGSSSIDVAFASLSSVGSTEYVPTTTQIHRAYAPSLKSPATAGAARFEHDPETNASQGILIEGQSTNLATYGSDLTNAAWNPLSAFIGGTAVGPDGTLSAVKLVASAGSGLAPRFRRLSLLTDTTQTFSIYVKPLEFQHLAISADGSTSCMVLYNLSGSGAITSATGATGTVEQCGNGWFRVSYSYTTTPSLHLAITMQSSTTYQTETGNGYDGMLFALAQLENQSFASSFIGTTSSTATRAADSMSITDSSLFSGNEGTIAFEGQTLGGSTGFGRFWSVSDGTNDNRIHVYPTSSTAVRFRVYRNNIEQRNVASGVTDVTQSNRYAFAYEDNKLRLAQNGSLITDDSNTAVMPEVNKLSIGMNGSGSGNQMNGYVKRIAFYNQSLSDTEMASLSS